MFSKYSLISFLRIKKLKTAKVSSMKKRRPILKIKLEAIDWVLEILTVIFVLLLIGLPIYFYGDMPDQVPSHFNAAGEPDAFGSKKSIWGLPFVGLIMAIGLTMLNRIPHLFNYPVPIDKKNARQQYRKATRLIRAMKTVIVGAFAYIGHMSIQTALGHSKGLGNGFLIVLAVLIFGIIIFYMYRSGRRD